MSKKEMISEANFDELISMIEAARARAWQAVNLELVAQDCIECGVLK